jgi:Tfp pilus assembly protein PilF
MKARLLLILLLLPATSVTATPEEARKHFEEGMRLLAAKERGRALEELKRAIELDEQYLEAHREYRITFSRKAETTGKPSLPSIAEDSKPIQTPRPSTIFWAGS